MNVLTSSPLKEASFSAVIIRADGTREELGEIAYYNKNPFKRLAWYIKKFINEKISCQKN